MPTRQALLIAAGLALLGLVAAALVLTREHAAPSAATSPAVLLELRAIRALLEERRDASPPPGLPRPDDVESAEPPRAEPLVAVPGDADLLAALAELTAAVRASSAAGAGPNEGPAGAPPDSERLSARLAELAKQVDTSHEGVDAPPDLYLAGRRHVLQTLGRPNSTWEAGNGTSRWTWWLDPDGHGQITLEFVGEHCVSAFRNR